MFVSLPEHHFPMPAGLAVPGAIYARTMSLSTHAAWYVLTVRFLEDDLTAQTFLLAWDTDVADAIRTGQGHVEVESLMFVTPSHADFGQAKPHHAYLFANRRATRMKVLVHDGIGVWLAARRLNRGGFVWPQDRSDALALTREQLDAVVLGLPWQRVGEAGIICVL